jgi:osomolarity two-component system sensor histidine kinase SLN1
MRIPIREQLALLVSVTCLTSLAVISVTTWVNNYNFVVGIKSQGLTLTASLKAAQITADLELLQTTCGTIVSRLLIQSALQQLYLGIVVEQDWTDAANDVHSALASGAYSALLQVIIYPKNETGNWYGVLNATADNTGIILSYTYPNGSHYMLGDPGLGYPPQLYPNLTFHETSEVDPLDPTTNITIVTAFGDFPLNKTASLLLGPLQVNDSYAMLSLTLPIINNTSPNDVLGYMTVVAAASSLISVTQSREGLDSTGIVLLVGSNRTENHFKYADQPATASSLPSKTDLDTANVKYIFPPYPILGQADRHSQYNANLTRNGYSNFSMGRYQSVVDGFGDQNSAVNNASSTLSTTNEQGVDVAVGYARPQSTLVDWLLIVEQTHKEAWAPIIQLRNILLACVFGTLGGILILVVPIAHFSVRPIRRLRDATEKSVAPPGYTPTGSIQSERLDNPANLSGDEVADEENIATTPQRSKTSTGFLVRMRNIRRGGRRRSKAERNEEDRRRVFKIPGKVQDRKHLITDELTELTSTFNEMSDELMLQYASLEKRVADRTRELEISKKAAEAANESKTLFIANISHELKTPLNGILGMCAVCMGEDDLPRIKRSLQVVYKSGDLLLHLLNDLLTFSKNQIGQQLSLEEKEFRLADIKSQITTIFDKQVREGRINFGVNYISADTTEMSPDRLNEKVLPALGPHGVGRLKNMW